MGEAKNKARLRERLGERRGDGYDSFLEHVADLRATPGARVDQLDRLRFHELLTTALIEGCQERAGDEPTPRREVEVMEAACMAAGVSFGATFFARVNNTDAAIEAMANTLIQTFAAGVMIAAQSALNDNGPSSAGEPA